MAGEHAVEERDTSRLLATGFLLGLAAAAEAGLHARRPSRNLTAAAASYGLDLLFEAAGEPVWERERLAGGPVQVNAVAMLGVPERLVFEAVREAARRASAEAPLPGWLTLALEAASTSPSPLSTLAYRLLREAPPGEAWDALARLAAEAAPGRLREAAKRLAEEPPPREALEEAAREIAAWGLHGAARRMLRHY